MSSGYYKLGANARVRDGVVPGNGEPMPRMALMVHDIAMSEQQVSYRMVPVFDTGSAALSQIGKANARDFGFTGNCCGQCGSYQMVRNGTCEKCAACGATTGCS